MAMAYHSYIAATEDFVEVQPDGPLWRAHKPVDFFNETYTATELIEKSVPTLQHSPCLYLIVGIQPAMTLLAFIMMALLFRVPISRDLGLVSLLAGADHDTLKLLKGAAYSGELLESVPVRIDVSHDEHQTEDKLGTVKYYIGDSGSHGIIRRGYVYT
ncbi:hypothetical protein FSARC_4766 [Fusarium sarcochroum]|uniref:Uncharacterized protein n=1 Tax=Fusarium sarcochroum TaxID=1208366 RepID=A0A8H4U0X8_9HYPO|nr:hypothetical protein FSARC_4766 [Fusarium sarcochroum]